MVNFLAKIGEEAKDAEAGGELHDYAEDHDHEQRDCDPEHDDQRSELLERPRPVLADRICDRPQHAQRREAHDQSHGAEQHLGRRVHELRHQLRRLADQGEAHAEDDGEEQHL
jgi:hypothetical protein